MGKIIEYNNWYGHWDEKVHTKIGWNCVKKNYIY